MTVYSYIRVSSRGQVEGDGPDRQRDSISKFCNAHGLKPFGEFFDKAVSGTVEGMDRPAFADMLERVPFLAVNGIVIEAIVVERVDRLARDLMVSEVLLAECRKRGIKVYAADQGALLDMATNGGDPTRVLIRQVMGALAEWDKSTLVLKLRTARERKKALTGYCCGNRPYGHYPDEQKTIAYVKQLFQVMPLRYVDLAQHLNERGIKMRNGGEWSRLNAFKIFREHLTNIEP